LTPGQAIPAEARNPSRRRLLAGAAGAGVLAGGLGGYFARPAPAPSGAAAGAGGDTGQAVAFYGSHQAGVATPAQDRLAFGTLGVVPGAARADVRDLLRAWTTAAARGMFLSRRTVQAHISHILAKLGAKGRVDIVREALLQGIST
jgi:deferrochelatase/peroxidase EfeB